MKKAPITSAGSAITLVFILLVAAAAILPLTALADSISVQSSVSVSESQSLSVPVSISSATSNYTITMNNLPANSNYIDHHNNSASFNFIPDYNQAGTYNIQVTAAPDNSSKPTLSGNFTVVVNNKNRPPVIAAANPTSNNPSINEGEKLSFVIVGVDYDNNTLYYKWYLDGKEVSLNSYYDYTPGYDAQGQHNVTVVLSDGTASVTRQWNVKVNNVDLLPIIIDVKTPSGTVTSSNSLLSFTTSKDATCKYGKTSQSFSQMNSMQISGGSYHESELTGLSDGLNRIKIECQSQSMTTSKIIDVYVDLPADATITLDKNEPINAGNLKVTLDTSKSLSDTPTLNYYYESDPKKIYSVPLQQTNSTAQDEWTGKLIVPDTRSNTILVFQYTGFTLKGTKSTEISGGKTFDVDTQKPSKISIIRGDTKNNGILLQWHSDDNDIRNYRIYRSQGQSISELDYLTTTNDSEYFDTNISSGKEYIYSVAAVDKAGNVGPFSDKVDVIAQGQVVQQQKQQSLTNLQKQKVNETIRNLDVFLLNVNSAISSLTQKQSQSFQLQSISTYLQKDSDVKQEATNYRQQLTSIENSGYYDKDISTLLSSVNTRLDEMKKEVIKDVSISGSGDFIQSFDESRTMGLLQEYVTSVRMPDSDAKKFIKQNSNLQSNVKVSGNYNIYKITTISGEVSYDTEITETVTYQDVNPLSSATIIVSYPSEMENSLSSTSITPKPYSTSNTGARFKASSLGYDGMSIKYSVPSSLYPDNIKKLYTVVVSSSSQSGDGITGNAVSSGSSIARISLIILGILVVTIVIGGLAFKLSENFSLGKGLLLKRADRDYLNNIVRSERDIESDLKQRQALQNNTVNNYSNKGNSGYNAISSGSERYQNISTQNEMQQQYYQSRQHSELKIPLKYLTKVPAQNYLQVSGMTVRTVAEMIKAIKEMDDVSFQLPDNNKMIVSWLYNNNFPELADIIKGKTRIQSLKELKKFFFHKY